eukprot:TRINITY_DN4059_c0_g1_i1.p1 TRINITY_DN4059_c0_g1~~TRINITY_DN4059_c0_g1_i1.p1  ORF type:complete len:317 (+),score=75.57 TRINITY_DN4059_c0_g1_i1:26-952(+)
MNPSNDAEDLYHAMKGIGTDEKSLINIIGRRPNWHLQKVREEFKHKHKKDLIKEIKSETSFNFKELLVELLRSRAESKAEILYKSMKGLGTNEHAIIDILMTTDSQGIVELEHEFKHQYKSSLKDYIKGDTSGNFERVLIHAINNRRSLVVEPEKIEHDVEILYKAGEGRWGTDETAFIDILTSRSHEHLLLVNKRYEEKHKSSLKKAIKKETSGWFKTALLANITLPQTYWAKRINDAIKGIGTNDSLLIRCFSINSKILLVEAAKEYHRLFKVSLESAIKGDTSGDYSKLLLTLLDLTEYERRCYF